MRQLWTKPGRTAASAAIAAGVAVAALLGVVSAEANAQQRLLPIPAKAKRADITFNGTPEILVDGKPARLAPGARITGTNNMLTLPGTLKGTAKAKYTLEDTTGMVMGVWILTAQEITTPDPNP